MNDKQNNSNSFQGQLKASSTLEKKFVKDINYFDRINEICNGQLSFINRLGIYWDRIGNRRVGQQENTPMIIINGERFQLGYNYMLQFRDVQITSIYVTKSSSPQCYFDFVGST